MKEEMMAEISDRFALPLLAAAQAQKEMTHNEALALIDLLICPVVQSVSPVATPLAAQPGQCWIVGGVPTGAWAGQARKIAGWTLGGWRFVAPVAGMSVWSIADSTSFQFDGAIWAIGKVSGESFSVAGHQVVGSQLGAIAGPAGGTVIDVEARGSISAILAALSAHGLIAV